MRLKSDAAGGAPSEGGEDSNTMIIRNLMKSYQVLIDPIVNPN